MKTTIVINNQPKSSHPGCRVGTAAILISIIVLRTAQTESAVLFDVPATVPWTDTGIYLSAGDELLISASGKVNYGPAPVQSCDANGAWKQFQSGTVLPGANLYSLIGKTGGTTAIGDGTAIPEGRLGYGSGFVGTYYCQLISTGGELYLGFNDGVGTFSDNSGDFLVTLSVIAVPEPAVVPLIGLGTLAALAGRMLQLKHGRQVVIKAAGLV